MFHYTRDPETNSKFGPENRPGPKKKVVFQPYIFRCNLLGSVSSLFCSYCRIFELGDMILVAHIVARGWKSVFKNSTCAPIDLHLGNSVNLDLDFGSTISTLLHDKINPKCQVLSLGDSGFLQIFEGWKTSRLWQTPSLIIIYHYYTVGFMPQNDSRHFCFTSS